MRWNRDLFTSYFVVIPPLRTLGLFALRMAALPLVRADYFTKYSQVIQSNLPPTAYCTKVLSTPIENGKVLLSGILKQNSAALFKPHGI